MYNNDYDNDMLVTKINIHIFTVLNLFDNDINKCILKVLFHSCGQQMQEKYK